MERKRSKVNLAEIKDKKELDLDLDYKVIYGWEDSIAVANDVWKSGSYDLLKGRLLFAYRNTTDLKSGLYQIIIVQNLIRDEHCNILKPARTFGVSMVTTGYSMLLPEVSFEYLEAEVLLDLQTYKVIPKALDTFKMLLENIKQCWLAEDNGPSYGGADNVTATTHIHMD